MKKKNWNIFSVYRGELFGISIIAIIILHFFEDVQEYGSTRLLSIAANFYTWTIGSTGVDIFLFLSGMGLFYSLKKGNLKRFYQNRFRRIIIPYILFGTLYWIIFDFIISPVDFGQFILDLTLCSFWINGQTHFWYVAMSIVCYLLFPLLFKIFEPDSKRNIHFLIILFLYIILDILIAILFPSWYADVEIGLNRFGAFIFGSYAGASIYQKQDIKKMWLFIVGIILRFGCLLSKMLFPMLNDTILSMDYPVNRLIFSWCGLGYMMLLALLLTKLKLPKFQNFLSLAGTYSFELYITHVSVRTIMNRCGLYTASPLYYMVMIIVSAALSYVLKKSTDIW